MPAFRQARSYGQHRAWARWEVSLEQLHHSQTSVFSIHPHHLCLHKRLSFPNSNPDVFQNIIRYQMRMKSNLKIAKLEGLII